MPANLTPQYLAAEERYKSAKDDREKLKALKDMLATIPKHKGTEKLQADIKRKIARLKDEIEVKKAKGGQRFSFSVEREGAGQVMVLGPPNVGKSTLINSLTGANLEVGDYPFTTRLFHPAMMPVEDIQIQLVDLPALSDTYHENWVSSMIRISDMAMVVVDISRDDVLEQMDSVLKVLDEFKVKLQGKTQIELADDGHWVSLKAFVVANKADLPGAPENYQIFEDLFGKNYEIVPVSAKNKTNLDSVKSTIWEMLEIVRVYSKKPGHEPEMDKPFTFRRGETLLDFAKAVHKDFARNLKFARVWGKNVFDGQRINRDYILCDGDVIELHM